MEKWPDLNSFRVNSGQCSLHRLLNADWLTKISEALALCKKIYESKFETFYRICLYRLPWLPYFACKTGDNFSRCQRSA